jgi:hypothetical protein
MEVHTHTHTPRKKWTHYFWEFLMLFLAVFCGFLAENQREHYVEHQREKQYISSLVEDLKTDTVNIRKMLGWFNYIQRRCDSLIDDFGSFTKYYTQINARLFQGIISGYPDFIYTDRTIQQLKNAGGMRMIRNLNAVDSIIDYDAAVRDILIEETGLDNYWQKLNDFADNSLSYRNIKEQRKVNTADEIEQKKINFWITTDTKDFDHLYNLVLHYNQIIKNYSGLLGELKHKGTRLILLLQEQYHLK